MREKAETVELEFRESMTQRLEKGYLLPGQADLLFSAKQVLAALELPRTVFMTGLDQRLPGMTVKEKFSLTGKKRQFLSERLRAFDQGFKTLEKGRLESGAFIRFPHQGQPFGRGFKRI